MSFGVPEDRYVFRERGIHIKGYGGYCPVQAEGTMRRGLFWYFRSRGRHMRLYVGISEAKVFYGWQYCEEYKADDQFAAGWIEWLEFVQFMERALGKWQEEHPLL